MTRCVRDDHILGVPDVASGIANAYALGVWRIVSIEGLRELAPLIVITGLVGGAMAALSIWKRRHGSRNDD